MIKLIDILNEIKVNSNKITAEQLKELWDQIWTKLRDPNTASYIGKTQVHKDFSYALTGGGFHSSEEWLKSLSQHKINAYYQELKLFQTKHNLQEIQVHGNKITSKMVDDLYNKLWEINPDAANATLFDNGFKYSFGSTDKWLATLNPSQINKLYQDLNIRYNKFKK